MTYKIPYTFVPGTKAKANEVNSNFAQIVEYLTELNEDIDETRGNLDLVSDDVDEVVKQINESKTKLAVNSATGTIMTLSGTTIYFNSSFILTDIEGKSVKIESVTPINTVSCIVGTHNIFINTNSETEILNNTISRQKEAPETPETNDVWINTSQEPLLQYKWNGGEWVEYTKIALGSITIDSENTRTIEIFPFNQNGYDINTNSELSLNKITSEAKATISNCGMPNYSAGVGKSWNTVYLAETDGYLFARGYLNDNQHYQVDIGTTSNLGTTIVFQRLTDTNNYLQSSTPIPKGYYYRVTGSGSNAQCIFYPTIGS